MKGYIFSFLCVSIILLVFLILGCDNPFMYDLSSAGYSSMANDPTRTLQQRQGAALMSSIMANEGRRQHELNVAREGRSQININTGDFSNTVQNSYPNTIKTSSGQLQPAPGFSWVTEKEGDFRVQWQPGKKHSEHPNVIAASEVNQWKPAPGYRWITNEQNDFRVNWQPGITHPEYPNVIAGPEINQWRSASGYRFINKESGDLRVEPVPQSTLWDTYKDAAIEAYNVGNYEQAERLLMSAIPEAEKISPDSSQLAFTLYLLGRTNISLGKYSEAKSFLKNALTKYEKHPSLDERKAEILLLIAAIEYKEGNFYGVKALTEKSIEIHESAKALNSLAWLLSTADDDGLRNGPKAVEYAKKAIAFSDKDSKEYIAYLDTLAAAYAESGQFDMAIQTQELAISKLSDSQEINDYSQRLSLYKNNTPLRFSR